MSDILSRLAQEDLKARLTDDEETNAKLRAVAKGKSARVRLLTDEEYAHIEGCAGWQNGYLMVGTAQVVVSRRENGQYVAFRL